MQHPVTNSVFPDGGGDEAAPIRPRWRVKANHSFTRPPPYHNLSGRALNEIAGPTAATRGCLTASSRHRSRQRGSTVASLLRIRIQSAPASIALLTPTLTPAAKPVLVANGITM